MKFRCIVLRECVQIITDNLNDVKVLQEQKRIFNEHINELIEGAKNTEQQDQSDNPTDYSLTKCCATNKGANDGR